MLYGIPQTKALSLAPHNVLPSTETDPTPIDIQPRWYMDQGATKDVSDNRLLQL
jgi:hypothetical protein